MQLGHGEICVLNSNPPSLGIRNDLPVRGKSGTVERENANYGLRFAPPESPSGLSGYGYAPPVVYVLRPKADSSVLGMP
jgi:hypothetical protein